MATSRLERIGTIYSRVTGLLRSGAMKYEDRPLWFEIYEAFPPKNEPPTLTTGPLPKILYPEDSLRAKFHKSPSSRETLNLLEGSAPSRCQRFISAYQSLESSRPEASVEELFVQAASSVQPQRGESDGLRHPSRPAEQASLASAFRKAQVQESIAKLDLDSVMKDDK